MKNYKSTTAERNRQVSIKKQGGILKMVFDAEPDAIQTAINPVKPHQLEMMNLQYLMGILLFIEAPEKILILGVGAGSLIQFFRHYLPESHITGVDYDQELLQLAHSNMMLPQADERLLYVIDDAKQFISTNRQQYDLIVVDIFDGNQSPDWTRDKHFTGLLKTCLSHKGALAYNMLISSESVFKAFYRQLRQTFSGQTLCVETEEYENLLLYALNGNPEKKTMMQQIELAALAEDKFELPFSQILAKIYDINPVDSGII